MSLTYHKFRKQLVCHYCGYYLPIPSECPDCGSPDINTRGFGTEKIEDELKPLFPGKRIERMDLDTTQMCIRDRFYAALVCSLSDIPPENVNLKEIVQLLDEKPVVLPQSLELWKWIADYYCCTLGDVFRAALPAGLKLESKSKVTVTESDEEHISVSYTHLDVYKRQGGHCVKLWCCFADDRHLKHFLCLHLFHLLDLSPNFSSRTVLPWT